MRPIKFRCWFNHRMWYGIPAIHFDENGVRRVDLNHEHDDFCATPDTWGGRDDYVLMQWTGLHDKNGREIYEGDLVVHPNIGEVEEVYWCEREACFACRGGSSESWLDYGCEVIGNIHQSPDLLDD